MLLDTLSPAALVSKGIVAGIANEDYHAAPGASKTGLGHFRRSPAHYQAYLAEGVKETPALRFGRILHQYILEPDECLLAAWDGPARNTKAGKEAWEQFQVDNQGRQIVSADEFQQLEDMRQAVQSHPAARDLLSLHGRAELSKWIVDQRSGVLCKARPDYLTDAGFALDLKSCEDASPAGFAKACAKYGYDIQAAFYPDVLGLEDRFYFPFIAVEKSPPYAVGVYVLDAVAVEHGRYLYQRALLDMAECMSRRTWPAYSQQIETLSLPAWATKGE